MKETAISRSILKAPLASLAGLLARFPAFRPLSKTKIKLGIAVLLTIAIAITLILLVSRVQDGQAAVSRQTSQAVPSQTLLEWRELLPFFAKSGSGPLGTSAEVFYMPPVFFQALDEELPGAAFERPTLVFRLSEADHEHVTGLTSEPPPAFLRVDGGEPIQPYQIAVLRGGDEHRTSEYLFPMPAGLSQETLDEENHTLSFVIPAVSGENSVFSWQFPLDLPERFASTTSPAPAASTMQVASLRQLLTRGLDNAQYEGQTGIRLEATFATPEYVSASLPKGAASRYLPDQFTLFLLTEKLHTADLPGSPPDIVLSLDGNSYSSDLVEAVTASPHHRITLVRFPVPPPLDPRHHIMNLSLAGEGTMTWHLPVSYAGSTGSAPNMSWAWVLAVLGGVVASMWPCLFQLTVFFIPALGGLSMHEASGSVPLRRRTSVIKAALFFVLGFTVVYTVAGALVGFVAGRLGDLSTFYVWQRYFAIGGGIVIVLLALRAAAQVRAPLVCKMPALSRFGHRDRPANPLETMLAGVAFATGCMTCFGAAMVTAMVLYVGLAGSALVGAFILFLFSLGMGIPLVIAAFAMAKVLPLLSRFENAVRWMGLASSLVMVGFAVLLITGNYMILTEWVYRLVPASTP